jgi:hypothetical protein
MSYATRQRHGELGLDQRTIPQTLGFLVKILARAL